MNPQPIHCRFRVQKLILTIFVGVTVLCGCTPDAYRRSADRQVQHILSGRTEKTLGYQPQVDAPLTVDPQPTAQAYDKIPVTPLPPQVASPMEPLRTVVPFGKLGPPAPQSDNKPTMPDPYQMQRQALAGAQADALGPPAPDSPEIRLDLFGVLEYGVQNSRTYQTRMEDLFLSALDVTLARHLFEPRPFLSTGLTYNGGQADVSYRSALNATANAGVRQRLPYGGELVAEALVGFVSAINGNIDDGENAELALRGSVPLLRGAGLTNLEPLISGERELVYQIRAFEEFRRSFVVDLAQQYFNLLTRQQAVSNRQLNYRNLAMLTQQTQALYDAGKISFLEVQRSLQSLLSAQSSLINAEQSYESSLDSLKISLGMPVERNLNIVGVELQLDVPDITMRQAVELAMRYRLSLRTAEDQIDDARRGLEIAKNGLLPDLTLTGRISTGNRFDRPAVQLDSRTLAYEAGLTLDLPVDRVAERNTLRRQMIQLQRAMRGLEQSQSQAAVNARNALRAIHSAQQNLQIQRLGIDLARRRLDFANQLLIDSRATARDLVEAQSSLLSAQDAYDRAKADLQISVLQFLDATGTLRVDPQAGALGQTMDRAKIMSNNVRQRG